MKLSDFSIEAFKDKLKMTKQLLQSVWGRANSSQRGLEDKTMNHTPAMDAEVQKANLAYIEKLWERVGGRPGTDSMDRMNASLHQQVNHPSDYSASTHFANKAATSTSMIDVQAVDKAAMSYAKAHESNIGSFAKDYQKKKLDRLSMIEDHLAYENNKLLDVFDGDQNKLKQFRDFQAAQQAADHEAAASKQQEREFYF